MQNPSSLYASATPHPRIAERSRLAPARKALGIVSRDRLLAFFDEALTRPLTTVVAPPGYGKTTLLAEWFRQAIPRQVQTAWISFEPGDGDPKRFLALLLSAFEVAGHRVTDNARALFEAAPLGSAQTIVTALMDSVAALEGEMTLYFDDWHLIEDEGRGDLLPVVIAALPPNAHLILASRRAPSLPLATLRTKNLLTEVETGDLRFRIDETAKLFQSEAPQDSQVIQGLQDYTDGWPAALHLVRIAGVGHFQATQGGLDQATTRTVAGYLREHILPRLPPEMVQFLAKVALLSRFNAESACSITGEPHAPEFLDTIVANNLFVFPLDHEEGWYRFHSLFRGFLLDMLQQDWPQEIPELHRCARRWFETQGDLEEAIRHGLAADHAAGAADLIEGCAMQMVERGSLRTLLSWLERLPRDVLIRRPRLLEAAAWSYALLRDHQKAERMLQLLADVSLSLESESEAIRATMASFLDNIEEAGARAQAWLESTQRQAPWTRDVMRNVLAFALVVAGEPERAREMVRAAGSGRPSGHSLLTGVYAFSIEGWAWLQQGEAYKARAVLAPALERVEQQLGRHSVSAAVLAPGLALACYELDDAATAERLVAGRLELIAQTCSVEVIITAFDVLARCRLDRHDYAGAVDLYERMVMVDPGMGFIRLHAASLCGRIRIAAARRDPAGAERLLRRLEETIADSQDQRTRSFGLLARARVALLQARPAVALDALDLLMDHCRRWVDLPTQTKAEVMAAQAWRQTGERERADALETAARERAEAGGCRASLRESFISHLPPAATAPMRRNNRAALPLDQLSEREAEIANLLAQGCRNKEIARALSIAPETVKWHLRNVYSKLHAGNRTEAVAALAVWRN